MLMLLLQQGPLVLLLAPGYSLGTQREFRNLNSFSTTLVSQLYIEVLLYILYYILYQVYSFTVWLLQQHEVAYSAGIVVVAHAAGVNGG